MPSAPPVDGTATAATRAAAPTSVPDFTVADQEQAVPLGGPPGLALASSEAGGLRAMNWSAVLAVVDTHAREEIKRLNELALAKVSAKDYEGAVDLLRRVLNLSPDAAAAHGNLGVALWQAGQPSDAEAHCRRAIALNRDYVPAYMILANLLRERGESAEALACYNRVVTLEPDNVVAHNNAGLVLRKAGQFAQAETAFARAAALRPDDPRIRFNQLMMRRDDASLPEAIECCRRSLEQGPDSADVLTNLAVALQMSGRFDEALTLYERAVAIDRNQHDARCNLALLLLLRGQFERGWREYEQRWELADAVRPDFKQPRWEGERLDGKTILLQSEQGFGDAIQFVRYVPAVAACGGRVVLRLERAVVRLAASLPGGILIKPGDARLPEFDVWCPLLSLPRILGTRIETIPAQIPYLAARAGIVERWRHRLAAMAGLRVGLVWAGNPKHINDLRRSIGIASLRPLLDVPGASFASLQVGSRAADLSALPSGTITDVSAELTDFAETAGAIANLDLVIAVDTAVAHVAGAIGKPTWVMLPYSPDWRWMLGRDDSPWYPTMRLYRQSTPGDWAGVVARVAADLHARAAAPHKVAQRLDRGL